jgi:hypothetical protein
MRLFWLLVLVLCIVPAVRSDLILSPNPSNIDVYWYVQKSFPLTVTNTNNFVIRNLTFSNTSSFTFPSTVDLGVNETKVLSYSVLTNRLFTETYITTLSYFYVVPFVPVAKTVSINVTPTGFVSAGTTIFENDTILWNNQLAQDVEIRDFGSGFGQINLPALSSSTVQYSTVKNFVFYNSPLGYTGTLNVISRVNQTLAHDSTLDRNVVFNLRSLLPASTMQVNLLSTTISVNNNQTYNEALIEVRNTDPNLVITNVQLSADRWASSFVPNNFNLPANGIQRVLFNITPYVARTNETNTSHIIKVTASSQNAGNATRDISIFINYMNMDVVNIGGINYTINVLGVDDTIRACLQHYNDAGFESCKKLEPFFTKNVTVIKEIEAQYKFGEADLVAIKGQLKMQGDIEQRLENKMNLYLDRQTNVESKVDNASTKLMELNDYVIRSEVDRNAKVRRQDIRFWVVFAIIFFILFIGLVLWMIDNVKYLDAMEEARQL